MCSPAELAAEAAELYQLESDEPAGLAAAAAGLLCPDTAAPHWSQQTHQRSKRFGAQRCRGLRTHGASPARSCSVLGRPSGATAAT